MLKKTIAAVGLASAATAGALFIGGSPASAQTTQASARSDVAYVQTIATLADRHHGGWHHGGWHGHWGGYYRHHHHHHHDWRYYEHGSRIVIDDSNTSVVVSR